MKHLILDMHFLAWRAFHSMGHLTHEDIPTGVIYGMLKDLSMLQSDHDAGAVAFCFDSTESKRKALFPEYKKRRHTEEHTEEETKARAELHRQIDSLREQYLFDMGFRNVFHQAGYESDDLIAALVKALGPDDEAVVVSSDKDLYQLLSGSVTIYNPNKGKIRSLQGFVKDYGIQPRLWAKVIAIAGCKTDEVPGIRGVGTTTALKYVRGELPAMSKKYQAIQNGWDIVKRNRRLVELPFAGVAPMHWSPDELDDDGWKRVTDALGMKSIRERMPWRKINDGHRKPASPRGFF